MATRKEGRIVIPGGTDVWPHELATARALAAAGRTVEFLPRREGDRVRSADVLMGGVVWEMKAPESSRVASLQRVLRRAGAQSHSVIVDTARMRGVADAEAERELRRLLPLVASVRRLVLVNKRREVVDIG